MLTQIGKVVLIAAVTCAGIAANDYCQAQTTTATVVIDNKTAEAVKVRFFQIHGSPTVPSQEFDVAKNQMITRNVTVPILTGGVFEVTATILATGASSPSSKFVQIEPSGFKIIKVEQYGSWYRLVVTDLAMMADFVRSLRQGDQVSKYLDLLTDDASKGQRRALDEAAQSKDQDVADVKKYLDEMKE